MDIIKINLRNLKLKTFTEQNVLDYCQINSINKKKVISLDLNGNELTDISGIKLFKNLKYLYMNNNKLKDISVIQNLKKLKILDIRYLELKSDQVKYINKCKNLEILYNNKEFENMSDINKLNKKIKLLNI